MAARDNLGFARGNRFPIWSYVKQDIKTVLCQEYDINDSDVIHVAKRNKQLNRGDFLVVVPSLAQLPQSTTSRSSRSRGGPKKAKLVKAKNDASDCGDVTRITDAVASASKAKLEHIAWEKVRGIQIREASKGSNGEIFIHLDRPAMFRAGLEGVVPREVEGTVPQGMDRGTRETKCPVVVNPAEAAPPSCAGEDITLCQLRTLLLSQHVSKLLQANGHDTALIPCGFSEQCSTQLQDCGLMVNEIIHRKTFLTEHSNTQEDLRRKINSSCYLYSPDVVTEEPDLSSRQIASQTCSSLLPDLENHSGASITTACHDNSTLLDLRAFMEHKKCIMLHRDYDKNLQLADVGPGTDIHSQLCALEQHTKLIQSQGPALTIHVVSGQHSFRQQQVDVAWRVLCETPASTQQVHLVHAGVKTAGVTSFQELFSERRKLVEKAAILKYGDTASEPVWKEKITALTMVGIQFQFLMTSCKHQVKLDGCDAGSLSEVQRLPGVFVMYNYARLVSLLAHFDAAVKQGTYPALPSVMDTDFGVLIDEDEWMLLFNYVLSFPSVVMETVSSISPNQLKADIQSHKICQFLCDLCRDLSSYYSRVRVLVESQPRLLPVMHARIHLLQAVAQVMHDSLALLNIQPISEL